MSAKPKPDDDEVLTALEAATFLRLSGKDPVRILKRLPIPYRRVGRDRLYLRSSVLAFVAKGAA